MGLAYRDVISLKWTGLVMAFGAGAIVSAVAYQLVAAGGEGRIRASSSRWPAPSAIGALTFYFADRWVDGLGGEKRLDFDGGQAGGSRSASCWGSLLDGVPESLVLGLSVAHAPQVSLAFVFAVAISNVPQGLGGTAGMLAAGWEHSRITRLWLAVCGLSVLAAAIGYWIGVSRPGRSTRLRRVRGRRAARDAHGSMIPEAFQHGGREAGLARLGWRVAVAVLQASVWRPIATADVAERHRLSARNRNRAAMPPPAAEPR